MAALPQPPLLLITDRAQAKQPLEQIAEAAFAAGCRWLLVREKDLSGADRLVLTRRLLKVAEPYQATVLVSGDLHAAAGAQGVQLPRDGDVAAARRHLGPKALIGVSAHDLREVKDAATAGADYVTMSPIFLTQSKPGYGPALGLDGLRMTVEAAPVPVLALAGIGPDNAGDCLRAGAAGVAVMGEVMRSDDPGASVAALLAAIAAARGGTGGRAKPVQP